MIRKLIMTSLLGALLTLNSFGISVTTVVPPNTFTNLLGNFPDSLFVRQVVIAANGTNAAALLFDVSTNSLIVINPAYTNNISYATNWNTTWTDFYGVTRTNPVPIVALIDLTNNVVPLSTNTAPIRLGVAAAAGTSARYDQVNYYFNNGIWATNTSSGIATITIVY